MISSKALVTSQINQAWKKEGRGGTADVTLGLMVKARKLNRTKLKGQRGSEYRLGLAQIASANVGVNAYPYQALDDSDRRLDDGAVRFFDNWRILLIAFLCRFAFIPMNCGVV